MNTIVPQNATQDKNRCSKCRKTLGKSHAHRDSRDNLIYFCDRCYYTYSKKSDTPEKHREAHLRNTYNITIEQYDQMLTEQKGMCYICHEPEIVIDHLTGFPRPLLIDHDHKTGAVRALLCHRCNRRVGIVEIDPDELAPARNYVEEMSKREKQSCPPASNARPISRQNLHSKGMHMTKRIIPYTDFISASEAASILSKKLGRRIDPSYIRKLKNVQTYPVNATLKLYLKSDIEAITIRKRVHPNE